MLALELQGGVKVSTKEREGPGESGLTSMERQHQRVWLSMRIGVGNIEKECALSRQDIRYVACCRLVVEACVVVGEWDLPCMPKTGCEQGTG